MRVGMQVSVVPSVTGGIYVNVSVLQVEEHQPAKHIRGIITATLDKSPVVETDEELRLWVNSVTRLVARTLEDDLYEAAKASISETDARDATR